MHTVRKYWIKKIFLYFLLVYFGKIHMRVPISIIDRHVHLSQIDADKLFWSGYKFHIRKKLVQPLENLCEETLIFKWVNGEIENIQIIFPFKKETQLELFESDKKIIRDSDIWEYVWTLIWPKWAVYLNHWINIHSPHVHLSVAQWLDFWLKNNQIVSVKLHWESDTLFENVKIRAKDYFEFDFHISRELADQSGIQKWDWGEIILT